MKLKTKRCQTPIKIPQGMSIVEKDLIEITGQFLRLVSFNKSIFGTSYGELASVLMFLPQLSFFCIFLYL